MAKLQRHSLTVVLNGTDTNPYHAFNLTQNPFPQISRMENSAACLRLQSLGGDPIPHATAAQYIGERLKGFSEEFIYLVVGHFVPGKMIKFEVYWDE